MFASFYTFFKKRKLLLILTVIAIFAISIYTASKIKMQEDISQMLPLNEKSRKTEKVRKNIKFNDRLIIILEKTDSISSSNTEILTNIADSIFENITKTYSDIIDIENKNLLLEAQSKVYDIFFNNLPVFLSEKDLISIDSLLNDSALYQLTESNFKNLISPAGSFTKRYIKKDPLSLTTKALKHLDQLKPDDNFTLINGHIFTKDQKNLVLFINIKHETATDKISQLITSTEKVLADTEISHPTVKTYLFGAPVVAEGNSKRVKTDILFTVSIAMLLLIIFLGIFFRKIEIFLIIFMPALFGAAVSLAVIYFIQDSVSLISLGIGSVLTGISIDYSLHIINHFRENENIKSVFKAVSLPILMSSISTGVSFFALLLVSSKALQDLGLFAGISVLTAALFALLVLPHLIRKKSNKQIKTPITERIASYNWHKSKIAHFIILVLTLAGIFFADEAEFEDNPDKMNYMTAKTIKAQNKLNEISGLGYRTLYVAIQHKDLEHALNINQKTGQAVEKLKNTGVIESFNSLHPVLIGTELQKQRIKNWNEFFTEEKKTFIKNKLNEHGKKFGFKPNTFNDFSVLLEKKISPITPDHKDFDELYKIFGNNLISHNADQYTVLTILNIKEENKAKAKAALPKDEAIVIIDTKEFTEQIISVLKKDFNRLVYISLAAVFLILLLYYGRIELSIITFLPILLSWIWTLGIMSIFNLKFTIFNIIISGFIFGLGIDYSIFIMQGLLQNYRYGKQKLSVFKTSVLLSAITTVIAIGVLIFAKHPAMQSIALLSVIGISSVVFAAYTLLPVGFNYLVATKKKIRQRPITAKDIILSFIPLVIIFIASILGFITELILRILPIKSERKILFFNKFMKKGLEIIKTATLHLKYKVHNPNNEKFDKPAVIIANHQAHFDIAVVLMLHPKIIIMTNDWVQKNFFYGRMVRYAGFPAVSNGMEKNTEILKEKVKQGYSVLIFPENTRSANCNILRFHKGAFYYARELKLDILPILIHGSGHVIPKYEPIIKTGEINLFIEKRINPDTLDPNLRTQAKEMRHRLIERYEQIRYQIETPKYFKHLLVSNYIYKGPVLEHYTRIKTRSEGYYEFFHQQCPIDARITDIGCGYGYMALMLGFLSEKRHITGIDHDCNKIKTASHNAAKPDNVNFICIDALQQELPKSDIFILADVLHYLPKDIQNKLITKCNENLLPNGKIIIRDGNSEMKKKHKGTKLSEFFSVKLLKFNKTAYDTLDFTSLSEIKKTAEKLNLKMEITDNTKHTSNLIYTLSKTSN